MLLLVTNKNDFAVDFMITKLNEKKLPNLRLNPTEILDFGYDILFSGDNPHKIIRKESTDINLNEIQSIWYRRAVSPSVDLAGYSAGENNFISGEIKHLIEGLLLSLKAKWINPLDAVYLGERKLYQLEIASKIGFTVPRSIVTNDYNKAIHFFEQTDGSVICKPIFHGLLYDRNDVFAIHTNRVTREDLDELNKSQVPIYLQHEITRECDLRVTVVGKDVYAVEIRHEVEKTPDWRVKDQKVTQRVAEIPCHIKDNIFKLMAALNLEYGAIDLIKDRNGNYIFLEINPAGEWAWLENDLGLPISDSFIKLFYRTMNE